MNIGFYIPNVSTQIEEHKYIIDNINKLCQLRPYDNIVIFNNYFQLVDPKKKYYTLSINHAKYFKGILFLFDSRSAFLTQTFPGPDKQIIYLQTPEWSSQSAVPYMMWHNIYMNNKFETISGNIDIDQLIKTCWKTPLAQVDKFDYQGINDVIQRL
jgi:hypothetical protein